MNTIRNRIEAALAAVYSGADQVQAQALVDQLGDLDLVIVEYVAAPSAYVHIDTPTVRMYVRRSDITLIQPDVDKPNQCFVYVALTTAYNIDAIECLCSAQDLIARIERQ